MLLDAVSVWSLLGVLAVWPADELADLPGAILPGEAPCAVGAALGAPVGAGALEAVLLPACAFADEDIAPPAGDMALWLLAELLGAILPGEAPGAVGAALGAPVGAGAEVEVCAIAKPADSIRAAEAVKNDRICVS